MTAFFSRPLCWLIFTWASLLAASALLLCCLCQTSPPADDYVLSVKGDQLLLNNHPLFKMGTEFVPPTAAHNAWVRGWHKRDPHNPEVTISNGEQVSGWASLGGQFMGGVRAVKVMFTKALGLGNAAKGITAGEQVTATTIRNAMQDVPLLSQQAGGISLPRVQQYVDKILAGEIAPAIKVDGKIIVDGNHRYVAGRILGREPQVIQWPGARPDTIVPWNKVPVSPEMW